MKAIDITGKRFGRLVAIKYVYSKNRNRYWLFKCDCGNEKIIAQNNVMNKGNLGCGCGRGRKLTATPDFKKCPKCGEIKSKNAFYKVKGSYALKAYCKSCRRTMDKVRQKTPEYREYRRELLQKPEYREYANEQTHKCTVSYLKKLLSKKYSKEEITQEMIEKKREELMKKRDKWGRD